MTRSSCFRLPTGLSMYPSLTTPKLARRTCHRHLLTEQAACLFGPTGPSWFHAIPSTPTPGASRARLSLLPVQTILAVQTVQVIQFQQDCTHTAGLRIPPPPLRRSTEPRQCTTSEPRPARSPSRAYGRASAAAALRSGQRSRGTPPLPEKTRGGPSPTSSPASEKGGEGAGAGGAER